METRKKVSSQHKAKLQTELKLNLKTQAIKLSNKDFSAKTKVKDKDLSIATRQLATLLGTNLSINGTLKITADQLNNKNSPKFFTFCCKDIIQGKRLANSMKKYNKIFSNTYITLSLLKFIRQPIKDFNDLANYLEESMVTKQKITSALTYPIILFSFSVLVIVGLLNFVLPTVVDQFTRSSYRTSWLTSFLLLVSNNIFFILFFIGLTLIIVYTATKILSKNPSIILMLIKFLQIPLVGRFLLFVQLERYTKTMSLLLA